TGPLVVPKSVSRILFFVYNRMGRFSLLLVVIAAATIGSGTAAPTAPTLRIRAVAPFTVAGTNFAPGERVTLMVRVAGRRVATQALTAGSGGAFRTRFSTLVAVDPCRGSIAVSAAGASGSRAAVRRPCRPPHRQAAETRPTARDDEGPARAGLRRPWESVQAGCGTMRMYGFGAFHPPGHSSRAVSSDTEPAMITSSPFRQFAGVATLWFAV